MKKVLNEKVMIIVFVCLGFVNILSFLVVPFFGQLHFVGGIYSSPLQLFLGGFSIQNLLPEIFYFVYVLISLSLIILGLTRLLSKKEQTKKIPTSSNKNPFFLLSLILLTISVLAIPVFLVIANINNIILADQVRIPELGDYGMGFGTYTIFPLNALISLAYILFATSKSHVAVSI